jgi:sRNA-binding regulator protein Hfq
MAHLSGFDEYRKENLGKSVFKNVLASDEPWCIHLNGQTSSLNARIVKDDTYEVTIETENKEESVLKKLDIKYLYPGNQQEQILPLLKKTDKKVKKMGLTPSDSLSGRHFVKNKSLYPLMKEREVVFFTLLDGDIIRGVVLAFSMYDITVGLKGGIPLTLLRHSIYDLRNKAGRCYLKSFQQTARDWEKSPLFVTEE